MSTTNQRTALSELRAARATIDRLDATRHPEELAADLIEAWTAVEAALRSLMGGSVLSGQPLIRELRQRQLIDLEQAHVVLELLAVRERVQRADYVPTTDDVHVARDAYEKLTQQLASATGDTYAMPSPQVAAVAPKRGAIDVSPGESDPSAVNPEDYAAAFPRKRQPWWFLALLALALGAAAVAAYLAFGRGGGDHAQNGVQLYKAGQREGARRELEMARQENPKAAIPHIYLGRIAREMQDTAMARTELTMAVEVEPNNALANRELASFLLSRGQAEIARRFYVRAVQLDGTDAAAQGFLGCALIKLGRMDEGIKWLNRAGPGDWSVCQPQLAPNSPPPLAR